MGKKVSELFYKEYQWGVYVDEIKTKILENINIKSVHDCHLWTMDGEYNILTVHLLMVNKSISWQKAAQVKKEIR